MEPNTPIRIDISAPDEDSHVESSPTAETTTTESTATIHPQQSQAKQPLSLLPVQALSPTPSSPSLSSAPSSPIPSGPISGLTSVNPPNTSSDRSSASPRSGDLVPPVESAPTAPEAASEIDNPAAGWDQPKETPLVVLPLPPTNTSPAPELKASFVEVPVKGTTATLEVTGNIAKPAPKSSDIPPAGASNTSGANPLSIETPTPIPLGAPLSKIDSCLSESYIEMPDLNLENIEDQEAEEARDRSYFVPSDMLPEEQKELTRQGIRQKRSQAEPKQYKKISVFPALEVMVDAIVEGSCKGAGAPPTMTRGAIANLPIAMVQTAYGKVTLGSLVETATKTVYGIATLPGRFLGGGVSAVTPSAPPTGFGQKIDHFLLETKTVASGAITVKQGMMKAFELLQSTMEEKHATLDMGSKTLVDQYYEAIKSMLEALPPDVKLHSSEVEKLRNAMKQSQWPFATRLEPCDFVLTPEIKAKKEDFLSSYEPHRAVLTGCLAQHEKNLLRDNPTREQWFLWGLPGVGKSRLAEQLHDIYGEWGTVWNVPVDQDTTTNRLAPMNLTAQFDDSDPGKILGLHLGTRLKDPHGIRLHEESEQYFNKVYVDPPRNENPPGPTAKVKLQSHWNSVKKYHDSNRKTHSVYPYTWSDTPFYRVFGSYEIPLNSGIDIYNSNKNLDLEHMREEGEAIRGRFTILYFDKLTPGQKQYVVTNKIIEFLNGDGSEDNKNEVCNALGIPQVQKRPVTNIVTVERDDSSDEGACEKLSNALGISVAKYKLRFGVDGKQLYGITPYDADEKMLDEVFSNDQKLDGNSVLSEFPKQFPHVDISNSPVIQYFLEQDKKRGIPDARVTIKAFSDLLTNAPGKSEHELRDQIDQLFTTRWDNTRNARNKGKEKGKEKVMGDKADQGVSKVTASALKPSPPNTSQPPIPKTTKSSLPPPPQQQSFSPAPFPPQQQSFSPAPFPPQQQSFSPAPFPPQQQSFLPAPFPPQQQSFLPAPFPPQHPYPIRPASSTSSLPPERAPLLRRGDHDLEANAPASTPASQSAWWFARKMLEYGQAALGGAIIGGTAATQSSHEADLFFSGAGWGAVGGIGVKLLSEKATTDRLGEPGTLVVDHTRNPHARRR
jgi:hypothetical protein